MTTWVIKCRWCATYTTVVSEIPPPLGSAAATVPAHNRPGRRDPASCPGSLSAGLLIGRYGDGHVPAPTIVDDRAHPLPQPPLSPPQVHRAMLTLGRRSAGDAH